MSGRAKEMGVDFQQFVHGGLNEPEEMCYLYHLDPAYKHAQHYLGTTEDLDNRDARHGTSAGARLLEVQKEHGGSWHLVRTWAGGRLKELALKQQSGKRYCPECTKHPRAGDEMPDPKRHPYLTRKERAAMKAERDMAMREREIERKARQHNGPGVEDREFVPIPQPEPHTETPEETAQHEQMLTEMEALWVKQAREKEMQKAEAEARREGGEAGTREVLEAIERGMAPETAMGRHEEITGWLDEEAETPSDRAFADGFWHGGRYAAESVLGELERGEDAYTQRREPADAEMAG